MSQEAPTKASIDSHLFSSPKQQAKLTELSSTRNIIYARNIDLVELEYFDSGGLFAAMGGQYLSMTETIYPQVVRCFYADMQYEFGWAIETTMKRLCDPTSHQPASLTCSVGSSTI